MPHCLQWVINVSHHTFYCCHDENRSAETVSTHTNVYDDISENDSDFMMSNARRFMGPLSCVLWTVDYPFKLTASTLMWRLNSLAHNLNVISSYRNTATEETGMYMRILSWKQLQFWIVDPNISFRYHTHTGNVCSENTQNKFEQDTWETLLSNRAHKVGDFHFVYHYWTCPRTGY